MTEPNAEFIVNAINAAHGTSLTTDFFEALGRDTLRLEHEFNRRAGFTAKDDELPEFFYTETLPPTNHVARFHGADVHDMYERLPGLRSSSWAEAAIAVSAWRQGCPAQLCGPGAYPRFDIDRIARPRRRRLAASP